jgi:hypothetical protein
MALTTLPCATALACDVIVIRDKSGPCSHPIVSSEVAFLDDPHQLNIRVI